MLLFSIFMACMPPFSVWCFYAGYRVGKKDKMPVVKIESPAKKIEAKKKTREQQAAIERTNTLLKNIENYNGNGIGQVKL